MANLLSDAFTVSDLSNIYADINSIFDGRILIRTKKEFLTEVRETINLKLNELIKKKILDKQVVDYFLNLPQLNFIVKDISVINIDKNNTPYLYYYIYKQDVLLFTVVEFNDEFPKFDDADDFLRLHGDIIREAI
jgi:hypothetical protein